jgi:hypothetical protein
MNRDGDGEYHERGGQLRASTEQTDSHQNCKAGGIETVNLCECQGYGHSGAESPPPWPSGFTVTSMSQTPGEMSGSCLGLASRSASFKRSVIMSEGWLTVHVIYSAVSHRCSPWMIIEIIHGHHHHTITFLCLIRPSWTSEGCL